MYLLNQGKGLMDERRCRAVSETKAEGVAIEPLLMLKEAEPKQTAGRDWGVGRGKPQSLRDWESEVSKDQCSQPVMSWLDEGNLEFQSWTLEV